MKMMSGLCDQMKYYLIGEEIKNLGFKLKYDLSWYDEYPVKDGTNARNFQLIDLFPQLEFEIASKEEAALYRKKFFFNGENLSNQWHISEKIKSPLYINATFGDAWALCYEAQSAIKDQEKYKNCFQLDESVLNQKNLEMLKKIRSKECAVGVHVRRGDMSESDENSYFKVPELNYFVNSINIMKKKFPNSYFFFFSDDPNYVEEIIFPKFETNLNGEIVNINDTKNCFMDFFLLCECKHQIRSQGTMGEFSYILNKNPNKILIAPKNCRIDLHIKPDITT
ncbi:MAG: alpha-1,2-fucosyltransferase [Clostridiales bacterium]|nr:alpha-1,2-fucosyltransferase [Clostridiales bacterium]